MKTTGLTLAEAVKSGRPFKHFTWLSGVYVEHARALMAHASIHEALSSDWEIQPPPPKQTWTREEVEALRKEILRDYKDTEWMYSRTLAVFMEAGL